MDIETIKYIAALLIALVVWVLIAAPLIVCALFGYSPNGYKENLIAGLWMTAVILGVYCFVWLLFFSVETLSSAATW